MNHCSWCDDPWRSALIGLSRKGLRVAVISRHYGLRVSTVMSMLQDARRRKCLTPPKCKNCGVGISPQRVVCGKRACKSARDRDSMRLRRARFGSDRKGRVKQVGGLKEPHDFIWPELPPNPRERNARAPSPIVGAPIVHVESLLGVGHKTKAVREAAVAAYRAGILIAAPKKPRVITPFRPLASAPPRDFWEATRRLHASGRKRPSDTYVTAPPCCPTIGSLVHGRMAA